MEKEKKIEENKDLEIEEAVQLIDIIIKGFNLSKPKNKEDELLLRKIMIDFLEIKFFENFEFKKILASFIQYLNEIDFCKGPSAKMIRKVESLDAQILDKNLNLAISLNSIFNKILNEFIKIELEKVKVNKQFEKLKLIRNLPPFKLPIEPNLFIRFFDYKSEKISNHQYIVDFSDKRMRDCNDDEYQSNAYTGCKIVGFFNFSMMVESFSNLMDKFYCEKKDRKVIVWNRETDPEDKSIVEFRGVKPHTRTGLSNPGEYVLRLKKDSNVNTYKIPVKVYDNMNNFLKETFLDYFTEYFENLILIQMKKKEKYYENISSLANKYIK